VLSPRLWTTRTPRDTSVQAVDLNEIMKLQGKRAN
jgi:hypothetical protein